MKDFIKTKIRESLMPSFNLPNKIQPTPEEYQNLKTLTWQDISIEPQENNEYMFNIDIGFRNPELNKFVKSIVFSIQMINDMFYHPHLFLSDEIQGIRIAPKLIKAFIMDFGHIYVTKARTHNPDFTKMIQGMRNDPDFESYENEKKSILIIKKGNPDRDNLLKKFNS